MLRHRTGGRRGELGGANKRQGNDCGEAELSTTGRCKKGLSKIAARKLRIMCAVSSTRLFFVVLLWQPRGVCPAQRKVKRKREKINIGLRESKASG